MSLHRSVLSCSRLILFVDLSLEQVRSHGLSHSHTSLLLSHGILVLKNDGTWCFPVSQTKQVLCLWLRGEEGFVVLLWFIAIIAARSY